MVAGQQQLGVRHAAAGAASIALLLIAANGGTLLSASGMLSTRKHEEGFALSETARLEKLEAGIDDLRDLLEHQPSGPAAAGPADRVEKLEAQLRCLRKSAFLQ